MTSATRTVTSRAAARPSRALPDICRSHTGLDSLAIPYLALHDALRHSSLLVANGAAPTDI